MCTHIFREKQCKLPRISLIAICTALSSGDVFSKSHVTLFLHSIETDCSKLRVSISKPKAAKRYSIYKVNEPQIAKPSAPLIARIKQHFHNHQDSPGIKSQTG